MNLPKAIEIGELNLHEAGNRMPPDTREALRLLVEAGKRVHKQRNILTGITQPPLRGEDMI